MAGNNISIGFSPCPNDTFIFYALIHDKIDNKGISFKPHLADVEELNQMAKRSLLPVTKLSFGAFLSLTEDYSLLQSGSALGRNCGPLLISKSKTSVHSLESGQIAIPGELTTANFLLDFFLPFQANKEIFLFSDIEDAVQSGRVNAGVIIHENRFTYEKKGLVCLQDLGQYWEEQSGHPIPLGGIVCRKDLEVRMAHQVEELIRLSIRYAYEHEEEVMSYVRLHAQEMNDQVTRQHISLYVNHFSENLGPSGRDAITALFAEAVRQNRIHSYQNPFLPGNL